MIDRMVARLAARLETTPDDLDGWMQLGRAYAVLGEGEKAADAYDRAAALKPADLGIPLQAVATLLDRLKPEDPLPARAIALLRKVEAADPDRPEVLWYLGVAAARDSKPDVARKSWTRLLALLPASDDDAKMVRDALASLPK
jgi:cytochrome c-type biogenesis protein CcmH